MNTAEKIIMYGILGMFLLQSFLLFFTKKKALRLIPAGIFAVL